jgi:BirA family biotin operon repressor/biotin-[acetyl-CoA-carboxylase] ligase
MPARISADKLQEGLRIRYIGQKIFFRRVVDSTNKWAKELAELGASEGTVAIAETQTCGSGRLDRKWFSPRGGLWFSVILKPELKPAETVRLVFVTGLTVADVLHEFYGVKVETKWPNDILVNGRKVCGILSEMNTIGDKVNYVIVGVGINANFVVRNVLPKELWENATSLQDALGKAVRIEELFRLVLEQLENVYGQFLREGFSQILNRWKAYATFLGCQVEVSCGTEKWVGLALDVDNDGSLLLRLEDGTVRHVAVGDVSLRCNM